MGQTLLEYDVYRRVISGAQSGFTGEIDCGTVPLDQTWRIDQIAVGLYVPVADFVFPQPQVLVYDQANPGPTALPLQQSLLSLVSETNGMALWADADDGGSPITVLGGDQLAVIFSSVGLPGATYLVRVQYGVYQGSAGRPQPAAGLVPAAEIPVGI